MGILKKIATHVYNEDKYIQSILKDKKSLEVKCYELENLNDDFMKKNKELMISLRKRELELSMVISDYHKCLNELKRLVYTSKTEQKDLRESFEELKKRINTINVRL